MSALTWQDWLLFLGIEAVAMFFTLVGYLNEKLDERIRAADHHATGKEEEK